MRDEADTTILDVRRAAGPNRRQRAHGEDIGQ
jgi:hypothetical protein